MKVSETRLLPHLGFWFGAMAVSALAWTLYDAVNTSREWSDSVAQTYEVLQTTGEIKGEFSRALAAQRGYLISGKDAFLSERDQALEKVDDALALVKKQTSANPVQQRQIPQLEELIAARVALMHETARMRQAEGIDIAQSRAASKIIIQATKQIDDLIREMQQEEQRLLALSRAQERYVQKRALTIVVVAGLFSLIVLVPAYVGFIFQNPARIKGERKIVDMADRLPGVV